MEAKTAAGSAKASAGFLQMAMRGQKKGRRIGEQIAAWGGSRLTDDFLNGERYLKDADVTRRFLESLPRNGHRSEVQNYGIVGQTLWAFTEQHARKYPISDLDLPATKAANEKRGIEFVVPEPPATPPQPEKPMSPSMPSPIPDEPTPAAQFSLRSQAVLKRPAIQCAFTCARWGWCPCSPAKAKWILPSASSADGYV